MAATIEGLGYTLPEDWSFLCDSHDDNAFKQTRNGSWRALKILEPKNQRKRTRPKRQAIPLLRNISHETLCAGAHI